MYRPTVVSKRHVKQNCVCHSVESNQTVESKWKSVEFIILKCGVQNFATSVHRAELYISM